MPLIFFPARKPEGVGVRGEGKVAFSYALWLPLPREYISTNSDLLGNKKRLLGEKPFCVYGFYRWPMMRQTIGIVRTDRSVVMKTIPEL